MIRGILNWFTSLFRAPANKRLAQASYSSYVGGTGGDGSKWPGGLSSSGVAPILDHRRLRLNARSAFHTSLTARAIIDRHVDTVVDSGLRLSPTPVADALGLTPEEAEVWGSVVGAAFNVWASSKKITTTETMNLYQAQRLVGVSQQRDGEIFIRFLYLSRRDLLNPLQLGFVDPGQVRGLGFTNPSGVPFYQDDGIERDANGKEIAYNIWAYRNGEYEFTRIPAVAPRSGRTTMIHVFQQEYAGQGRGYSRLSHALQEFESITSFKLSEVQKAIAQSSLSMWVKPNQDEGASNPLSDLARAGPAGPPTLSAGAAALAEQNNIDISTLVRYESIPEARLATPGSVAVFGLERGEEIKPFVNTSPVETFSGFVECLATYIAASLSIPLEVVLMKFGQNYSASRAALLLFWRVAQVWRQELVSDFLNPIYEAWLAGEIGAARILAPGWNNPRMRRAWLNAEWIGAPMPNIDPAKTAKADQIYVELGAQTLDRVAMDHNGSDGKANRAKLARELSELPPVPWGKQNIDTGDEERENDA